MVLAIGENRFTSVQGKRNDGNEEVKLFFGKKFRGLCQSQVEFNFALECDQLSLKLHGQW